MADPVLWRSLVLSLSPARVVGYTNLSALVASLPVSTLALVKNTQLKNIPASQSTLTTLLTSFKNLERLHVDEGNVDFELLINSLSSLPSNSFKSLTIFIIHVVLFGEGAPSKIQARDLSLEIQRVAPNIAIIVPRSCRGRGDQLLCLDVVQSPEYCHGCEEIMPLCELCVPECDACGHVYCKACHVVTGFLAGCLECELKG